MADAREEVLAPMPMVVVPRGFPESSDGFSPLVDHDGNAIERRRPRACVGVLINTTQRS
jgi:hypothetical protein